MGDQNNAYSFIWIIQKYLPTFHERYDELRSPMLFTHFSSKECWYITINRTFQAGENYLSCYLNRGNIIKFDKDVTMNDKEKVETIVFSIELVGYDGNTIFSFVKENCVFKEKDQHGVPNFVNVRQLLQTRSLKTGCSISIRCFMEKRNTSVMKNCMNKDFIENWKIGLIDAPERFKTKMGFNFVKFLWRIKYFDVPDWSVRKRFFILGMSPIELCISCPENDILVDIRRMQEKPFLIQAVDCILFLLDATGKAQTQIANCLAFHFYYNDDTYKLPPLTSKSTLESTSLKNNKFTLICLFWFSNGIIIEERHEGVKYQLPSSTASVKFQRFSKLQKDLRGINLYKNCCDIQLKVDNKDFVAHKFILRVRSHTLYLKVIEEMAASKSNVFIPDIDADTFECLLKYLYTGKLLNLNDTSLLELLCIAHKYNIFCLKNLCLEVVPTTLNCKNISKILIVADVIESQILKKYVIQFIVKNRSIINPKKWIEIRRNEQN